MTFKLIELKTRWIHLLVVSKSVRTLDKYTDPKSTTFKDGFLRARGFWIETEFSLVMDRRLAITKELYQNVHENIIS